MVDYDVLVIGAGPAGAIAGWEVAREGMNVAILEEHAEVGKPISCGEGISHHILEEFAIEDPSFFLKSKIQQMRLFLPNQTFFGLTINGMTIDRSKFDQYLVQRAIQEGAELKLQHRALRVKLDTDKATVFLQEVGQSSIEELTAKVVIAADGPASRMAQGVGLKGPKKVIQGFEFRIHGLETPLDPSIDFYFDLKRFPRGYAWVFPRASDYKTANIGLVVNKPGARDRLEAFIHEVLHLSLDDDALTIEEEIGGVIPMTGPISQSYRDRFMVVGDAAGMANSVFYGGIRIAMTTGRLAAQTAVESIKKERYDEDFFAQYQRAWKQYPFADPVLQATHEYLYSWKNEQYNKLGTILNGKFLDKMNVFSEVWALLRLLRHKEFRRDLSSLKQAIKGLKISRDWGF